MELILVIILVILLFGAASGITVKTSLGAKPLILVSSWTWQSLIGQH
jgi:hypothetical protein